MTFINWMWQVTVAPLVSINKLCSLFVNLLPIVGHDLSAFCVSQRRYEYLNIMSAIGNCVPNSQQEYKVALGNFYGLLQNGGQEEFAQNHH